MGDVIDDTMRNQWKRGGSAEESAGHVCWYKFKLWQVNVVKSLNYEGAKILIRAL